MVMGQMIWLPDPQWQRLAPLSRRKPRRKACFSPSLYRDDERMFCRLKDWRRIAPRSDKHAANALAALNVAAMVRWS
jgi:hypothetical protein